MAGDLEKFSSFIAENKGQRKFKQTVELAVNFKGIDFTKQDNKLNVEVALPYSKGKVKKVAVFATDKNVADEAAKNGIAVIDGNELAAIAADQKRLNSLLEYDLVAQPNLMPSIAKSLGQFLGPRNKMPKPLIGVTLSALANELNKRISVRNRGKNLPTIHCVVGTEDMDPKQIYENVNEVVGSITRKVGSSHIKSAYVKLTMSKPFRFV
ncbi:MAG: 50S ribosomal protein L1 [Candidatus Micrarchaeota archaeon]|nr:50S ribosomal protein L1 [Candidatus Micrarchaeota archaeon]